MEDFLKFLGGLLWGIPMIILLSGTHLIMTAKTGIIQRHTFRAIKLSVTKDISAEGDISPFQALTTALASTIGTGNIIGLGTAVALGGAGAVFWCWVTGIFGIATKYAESLLAVKYRIKTEDGRTLGGAMYILENRLKLRFLAKLFAVFTMISAVAVGCGVQINAISEIVANAVPNGKGYTVEILGIYFPAVPLLVGISTSIIVCAVIFGGVGSISKVCEMLVPFMAGLYILGNIVILTYNIDVLPETVTLIVKSAFTKTSAIGGLTGYSVGAAVRFGISRGLFSNEAGTGTSPIIAAAAKCENPVKQALISATGTFWDTVVLCLVTGLVIVSSILKNDNIDVRSISGGELTYAVFSQIPHIGKPILIFGLITFAFSTILGWSYYGECCAEYLFGIESITVFRVFYVGMLLIAPLISLDVMWDMADILNALMAIPNLTALLLLQNEVREETLSAKID